MAAVQITILGLGQVGASIGLALAKAKDQVTRVGSDSRPDVAGRAMKAGAVDKNVFNIPDAVAKADAVILAVPLDELRMTMEAIAADLKPGVVVLDTSSAPSQFTAWAKELFPLEDRYPLTFTPAFNPGLFNEMSQGTARADLFQKSTIFITNPIGVDASAIQFSENLARILGGSPVFADAAEVDGLIASVRVLPDLAALALASATIGKPGWLEARKLASHSYAQSTQALSSLDTPKDLGLTATTQRAGVLNGLDVLIDELLQIRSMVEEGETERLSERIERMQGMRDVWMHQRVEAKWEDALEKAAPMPTFGETMGRLIGLRPKSQREQPRK